MEDIYVELRELSPEQRELMLRMLEKEGVDLARLPVPARRSLDRAPMSVTQQRLWAMHQLASGLPTENIPVAIELEGPIDVAVMSSSINFLVARHEILRTTFHDDDEVPEQRIHPHKETELEVIDLAGESQDQSAQQVESALVSYASQLFDLETDWLMRPVLFRMAAQRHILLLTFHQLVVDGWAVNVLMQELSTAYASFAAGQSPDLPAAKIQYADIAEWQQEGWEDAQIESQIEFWVDKLSGAASLLELPTGFSRPPVPAFTGAICLLTMPPEPVEALRQLAKQEGVTMFTAVLATLKVLLAAYSGQSDIVVGTLISRRSRVEAENMVGNFGNNILLRSQIAGTSGFREIIHIVNNESLDAMANQDAPLELVNAKLQQKTGNRIPAFHIGFIFRDGGMQDRLQIADLKARQRFVDMGTGRLDLWLDLADHGSTLSGEIQYRDDLFDSRQMDLLMRHWENAVTQLTRFPDLPVSEINIFSLSDGLGIAQGQQVEELLCQHPLLDEVEVSAPGPLVGGPAKIRFVRSGSADVTGTQLREWVTDRLDFELGPTIFTEADSLIVESLVPKTSDNNMHGDFEPCSELEKLISEIWTEELGAKQILPHDNFFDLGGHSLLAVQVLKRLQGLGQSSPDPKSLVTGTLRQLAMQMGGESSSPLAAAGDNSNTIPGKRSLLGRLATRFS